MPNTKQDLIDARAGATAARATLRAARAAYRADPTPAAADAVTDAIIALADALDATLTALRADRAASGPRPISPPDNLRAAVVELCAIAYDELDALCSAVRADHADSDMQKRLADWRAGKGEYSKGGWFPHTGTAALIKTFRPTHEPGVFEKAYQRANVLALDTPAAAHVLPKLKALNKAHLAFISDARKASNNSRRDLPPMDDHCGAVNALVLLFGL